MLKGAVERAELPRPSVSIGDAAAILKSHYGLEGNIVELGSQQDRNFRIDAGSARYVLKICRAEYGALELEAQNAALRHLAGLEGVAAPRPVPSRSGDEMLELSVNGEACRMRLLTYLDGEMLTRRKYLPEPTLEGFGRICGRLSKALSSFDHPGLERHLQWDMRKALEVANALLSGVEDETLATRVIAAIEEAERHVASVRDDLPVQAIHQDVTADNVVAGADADGYPMPFGVIDFGDLMRGWRIADLAVCCAALLHHNDCDPVVILPAVRAFHAVQPLTDAEARVLWPLIVQRAGVLVASGQYQLALEPDNAYVRGNLDLERQIFEAATSLPISVMQAAILDALGFASEAKLPTLSRLVPEIAPETIRVVPLDLLSDRLTDGNWLEQGIEDRLLEEAAGEGEAALFRYGEYRLTRTRHHSAVAPETYALHIDVHLPEGTSVHAPFAGVAAGEGHSLRLDGDGLSLNLEGIVPSGDNGRMIDAGEEIGEVAGNRLVVQFCRDRHLTPPRFVRPELARAWSAVCPSPSALLGGDFDAPPLEAEQLMATRQAHFAKPQKNYYRKPPQIERGLREHMYSTEGRTYLDMVNNVAILGHGHRRLADAVHRQWSLLNTNSRFHYKGIADFSKRLADLAPEGLDTVFLVNSGSEANDLALRLAWAHSGARNIISLLEAYHGWTVGSDAVSTSIADNPQALSTRPAWVHPVTAPNTYRGPHRGPDSAKAYVADVEAAIARIEGRGEKVGGFIAETVYGNAGGIPLPKGYLKDVYRLIRERGGVVIADEVQVGYGRLGHYLWGFEEQGVVPDIITVAKAMGNGHPLGAVITSRAIADSLEKEGYFFSSAGGSPVSCVVGMTVLDVIRDERLQENARDIGTHLKSRLEALGQRFEIVGAVHGMGLYLGLEFVRDRTTLEPATRETARICDRLLELGVIMQPTGDHLNVLKIKPPMCLSRDSADFFADMLAKVLEEGW